MEEHIIAAAPEAAALEAHQLQTSLAKYPKAMMSRAQLLDAGLIDGAFMKMARDQLLDVLSVEGGSSGLAEFDTIEEEERQASRGGGGGAASPHVRRLEDGIYPADSPNRDSLQSNAILAFFAETLPMWRSRYQEELTLLLRLVVFRLTIGSSWHSSFGDRTMNIAYRSEHALRWEAVNTIIKHQQLNAVAVPNPSSKIGLFISSFLVSLIPGSLSSRLLSPSSPSMSANSFIDGSPLLSKPLHRPSLLQKVLLAVVTILVPYLLDKLRRYVVHVRAGEFARRAPAREVSDEEEERRQERAVRRDEWWHRMLHLCERMEGILLAAEVLNTVIFFGQGKYRTLAERALGLRLVKGPQKTVKMLNFALMNQQLEYTVYFGFTSLLANVLRVGQITSAAANLGRSALAMSPIGASFFGVTNDTDDSTPEDANAASNDRCGICGRGPVALPRVAKCGHLFCYYCITARLEALPKPEEEGTPCPKCGEPIHSVKPLAAAGSTLPRR